MDISIEVEIDNRYLGRLEALSAAERRNAAEEAALLLEKGCRLTEGERGEMESRKWISW
jgi:hypothetical protein